MRDYDSTVARIAGNILGGAPNLWQADKFYVEAARLAVRAAREIVAETKRTEPKKPDDPGKAAYE